MNVQCFECDGSGQKCNLCGESEPVCQGNCQDGGDVTFIDCESCRGVGNIEFHADDDEE